MGTGFDITLPDVRGVTGNVSGLLTGALNTALQVEALTLDPAAFSRLGAPVAAAGAAVHQQLAQTVRALLALLQQLNTNVAGAADGFQRYDQNAAASLGATAPGTPATPVTAGSGLGAIVAGYAQQAATPAAAPASTTDTATGGTPTTVGTVVGYLAAAQPGQHPGVVPAQALASPAAFADWLDRDASHQTALGVVKIFAGGQIRPGDVVVGTATGGGVEVGVTGFDGRLYNNGPVGRLADLVSVRGVYRPVTTQAVLW